MIIELPNYIDEDTINSIKNKLYLHVPQNKTNAYNRDGKTFNISQKEELKELDVELNSIFSSLQINVIANRYKPMFSSGDTGYEYHLYDPQDICHVHADGEIDFKTQNNTASLS